MKIKLKTKEIHRFIANHLIGQTEREFKMWEIFSDSTLNEILIVLDKPTHERLGELQMATSREWLMLK